MRKEGILISPSAATDHERGWTMSRTGNGGLLFPLSPPFSSQSKGRRGLRISYSRTALSTKSKLYREAENGLKKDLGRAWQNSKGASIKYVRSEGEGGCRPKCVRSL